MKTFNWLIREKFNYRPIKSDSDKFKNLRYKQLKDDYSNYVSKLPNYIKNDSKLGTFKNDFLIYVVLGKDYSVNSEQILKNIINDESYDKLYYDYINKKWLANQIGSNSLICWYSFKNNYLGKGLDELLFPFVNILKFESNPSLKLNLYSTLIIDTIEDYEMFLLHVPEICSTLRVRFIHL